MTEDKQCDGCYWRRPDWRDDGWCYMFKERFEGCVRHRDRARDPVPYTNRNLLGFATVDVVQHVRGPVPADVIQHLNECDRENDPPSAQEIGDGDYPDDRYDR